MRTQCGIKSVAWNEQARKLHEDEHNELKGLIIDYWGRIGFSVCEGRINRRFIRAADMNMSVSQQIVLSPTALFNARTSRSRDFLAN
jgi:hypothetical protein